ncbi:MAG TPA: hypothetical protein VHR88_09370 [Solirubrobacteraceae bacterium]|jgi:hypothetical protein|nr:hypothetical protein [Solirubrobacteraceae bacterium]
MTERARNLALRYLGAAALFAVGVDHLQQYYGAQYSAIPTIGTLFFLNFVSAVLVAAGLCMPVERWLPRWGKPILAGLAATGIGIALGSLAALLISEQTPLFGFVESGYRQAIVISIVLEVAVTLLLGGFLVGLVRSGRRDTVSAPGPGARGAPGRRL